ncbi:endopeptidase La [Candidatus Aerophobetes bacterium]|uniref:Lon protease n=1 Tax=Aerophobetes bacterium TaxID=2030807 RepID=A0A2A4X7Z1_UNCAE|nr:MAG: endopeptidase La [Candidatus Aerophobetes bacterium]
MTDDDRPEDSADDNESHEQWDEESLEEALLDSDLEGLIGEKQGGEGPKEYPEELFVIPLSKRPFFPGMAAPLVIEPGPYYEVLKIVAKSSHKMLGLFLTEDEGIDIYKLGVDGVKKVGVAATILRIVPLDQGGAQVVLNMERRIEIIEPIAKSKHLRVKVKHIEDKIPQKQAKIIKAYSISIITTIKELLKLNPLFKEELQIFLGHSDFAKPGKLADFAVALTTAGRAELQSILEAYDIQDRIDKTLVLLRKELDLSKLQSSINQKIEATISQSQREFFLREQMKTIKKELGLEKDDKALDVEKFQKRLEEKVIPEDVQTVIDEELEKLGMLDLQSAEYGVVRSYLDWLTVIPWGVSSEDNLDLRAASEILEEDHYGLKDIKERILEFIAVGKLRDGVQGAIICLVGPPGVGKTSIGKSVARALNRKFYRFSVGGMRDEAEIKGHRRTYVGAMPGKMIQAFKYTQTNNPVIMLDEVDKIGMSHQGDPASALLEVLDPEQNKGFLDHYLDVRCDLSNVLFIVTANVLDTIPGPLRDRMDVMRLSGYIKEEKVKIAQKYLIPRYRKEFGLKASNVSFSESGIKGLIDGYAREAGVRTLEKNIKKILRKVAYQVALAREEQAEGKKTSKAAKSAVKPAAKPAVKEVISDKKLEKYLSKPIFTGDRFYDTTPIGVCTGLAWTALGGATLYIESIATESSKTGMKLTGQAGDVMKESAQIAWSYANLFSKHLGKKEVFFDKKEVHIHIPEGATPKDGPSAGVTMVTSILSLAMGKPVAKDLGMTGELTLTGRVLPIGGLKEKLIAAKRSKLKSLIFPKENLRDYDELPDYLKKGIKVYFIEQYSEIFPIAFPKSGVKKARGK